MKKILCILPFVLMGCSNTSVVDTLADNMSQNIDALEATLSEECKTPAITIELAMLRSQKQAIVEACDSVKSQITQEKLRWKFAFFGLLGVIIAFIFRKVAK